MVAGSKKSKEAQDFGRDTSILSAVKARVRKMEKKKTPKKIEYTLEL